MRRALISECLYLWVQQIADGWFELDETTGPPAGLELESSHSVTTV